MPKTDEIARKGRISFHLLRECAPGLPIRYLHNQKYSYKDRMSTKTDSAALKLAALGHPARLDLFRLLVRAGPEGLLVGEIAAHLDMPLSTLAHHLRSLKQAGLIAQTRRGREVETRADMEAMRDVLDFLMSECCKGVPALARQI